jgi:hypothetical protein
VRFFAQSSKPFVNKRFAIAAVLIVCGWRTVSAVDHVELRRDEKDQHVSGRVLVKAADGGLLLMAADGELWAVQPDELVSRKTDEQAFEPLAREALAKKLLKELPQGFEVHQTTHYLICYSTSKEYANWCGALFERLYRGFTNYWTRKGLKLHEPEFPLVAVVFGDRDSYVKFAAPELKQGVDSIIGYYSLQTNHITMYDLTGVESIRSAGDRRGSAAQINAMLTRPEAEPMVATVIHEATHQIAFNCGLQTRFADIPVWVSEGLAVYFETPDLQSPKGWKNIGAVNHVRLDRFREYLARRPAGSLESLLSNDKRMRDPRSGLDAYAEAWALNYYLIRNHPKQYVAYMKMLSEKPQLVWDTPDARLKEFRAAFGDDLARLETDFLRQMQKVR